MTTRKRTTEGKALDALEDSLLSSVLGYQIAVASVLTNRIYDQAVQQPRGLHRLEYTLLMMLLENPDCTASNLAKALSISRPNMVFWLDRVNRKGLIEREPSSSDRRSNHLRLTARGEREAKAATAALVSAESAGLAGLTYGERAILSELLQKVTETWRK